MIKNENMNKTGKVENIKNKEIKYNKQKSLTVTLTMMTKNKKIIETEEKE